MRSPSAPNPSPIEQRQSAETTTSATGSFRVAADLSRGARISQEPALGALELLIWRLDRSGRSFARASCTRGAAGAAGRACAGVLQVALVERRGCSHGGALVCCARSMMLYEAFSRPGHTAARRQPARAAPGLQPVITTWVPGCAVWAASENNGTPMRQPYSARGWRHEAAATHGPPAVDLGRALQPGAVVQAEEEGEEVGADERHRAHQAQDEFDGELQGRERDGDAAQAAQAVGVLGAEGAERKGADGLRTHSGSEMRGRSVGRGPWGLRGGAPPSRCR